MKAPPTSLQRALHSLRGLTIGDQFGELFFVEPDAFDAAVAQRRVPGSPWQYTDDTEMGLSVVAVLRAHGEIQQDELMQRFAQHHDMSRGYGPSMRRVLADVRSGADWRSVIATAFEGQGSYGNGAAMRVGPLGAFFAPDLQTCVRQAELSSLTTHTHPEAVAGAIAVAIAAALAWRVHEHPAFQETFLEDVASWVPESEVRSRLLRAARLPGTMAPEVAGAVLGNGQQLTAQDTVPFALWCASRQLSDYETALWWGVSAGGDRDTICAIVGSVVALSSTTAIPAQWLAEQEPFPEWFTSSGLSDEFKESP
ncbi:hypothetical protein C8263_14345 [Deinococcus arcticus]|uniref:Crystallin J1 n=1 Tax=Deinococcus arcticus TaxID=2136176 RepID=A0A2T3W5Q2_9DEIO|nr:hypothetical protein C8263_14345 [Deinococcus arcticus]